MTNTPPPDLDPGSTAVLPGRCDQHKPSEPKAGKGSWISWIVFIGLMLAVLAGIIFAYSWYRRYQAEAAAAVAADGARVAAAAKAKDAQIVDPIAQAPNVAWRLRQGQEQFGPVKGEVMRQWIRDKRINPNDEVLREDWGRWAWARDVFTPQVTKKILTAPIPPAASQAVAASSQPVWDKRTDWSLCAQDLMHSVLWEPSTGKALDVAQIECRNSAIDIGMAKSLPTTR